MVDDEKEQRPRRRADGYERPLLAAEDPAGRTGNEPVQLGGGDPFGGGRLARGLDRDPRTVRCAHGRGVVGDEVGDLTGEPGEDLRAVGAEQPGDDVELPSGFDRCTLRSE
ncbi:MAG: hypothetical protein H7Y15_11850 [Pseudonocardia sp.]|nr:hypothetical protein [Pseudonocardia sp.]